MWLYLRAIILFLLVLIFLLSTTALAWTYSGGKLDYLIIRNPYESDRTGAKPIHLDLLARKDSLPDHYITDIKYAVLESFRLRNSGTVVALTLSHQTSDQKKYAPFDRKWWRFRVEHQWPPFTLNYIGRHGSYVNFGGFGITPGRMWTVEFPILFVVAISALIPLVSLIRGPLRRRRRRRKNRCLKCAYDLTGLPEPRCPECGTAISATLPDISVKVRTNS